MSTIFMEKSVGLAVTNLFLSIFGPVLAAAIVLFLATVLNIL